MPRLSFHHRDRRVRLDLHGYSSRSAIKVAATKIEEAWRNGYTTIVIQHGSRDVASTQEAATGGRGSIKWRLRDLYKAGAFDAWVIPVSETPSTAEDCGPGNEVTFELLAQPDPPVTAEWSPLPPAEFHKGRRL